MRQYATVSKEIGRREANEAGGQERDPREWTCAAGLNSADEGRIGSAVARGLSKHLDGECWRKVGAAVIVGGLIDLVLGKEEAP